MNNDEPMCPLVKDECIEKRCALYNCCNEECSIITFAFALDCLSDVVKENLKK